MVLFVFCLIFASFPLYAGYMPGFLWGVQLDLGQALNEHVYGLESLIGIPMQVVADTLIGFLVFGVVLVDDRRRRHSSWISPRAMLGTTRGGPAKVAIISSGFFGMLSGSPTSNVLTTGTLTIPTMKRCGYPATYAAAVEACASTGGALMPPVMGAAAFIMANFLNVPYAEVVVAAFLPALLFYFALFIQTDFYAGRNGLRGVAADPRCRRCWPTLVGGWYYIAAIVGLTVLLLAWRLEGEAPFWVSLFLVLVALVRARADRVHALPVLPASWSISARPWRRSSALIAGIGLIIGALSITGVANSFSRELVQYAGNNVPLLLATGALTSFILGMGMTASACYIFLAIVLAPALISTGLDPMAVASLRLLLGPRVVHHAAGGAGRDRGGVDREGGRDGRRVQGDPHRLPAVPAAGAVRAAARADPEGATAGSPPGRRRPRSQRSCCLRARSRATSTGSETWPCGHGFRSGSAGC